MRILVTPSARAELLETTVRIRQRDRREAARFIDQIAHKIEALVDGVEAGPELESPWRSARATEDHRLYLRERRDTMWLIAVWPDPTARGEAEGPEAIE